MTTEPITPADADASAPDQIRGIIARIRTLEDELESAFEKARADLRLRFEHDKVVFEEHVLKRHRDLKVALVQYVRSAPLMVVLTAPFVYAVLIPVALLDVVVSLYQATCFPVYGIPKVRRADYILFDRQHLAYLNVIEKLNCGYCAYANGIFAYAREIGARTEQYWCPIKHARRLLSPHASYAGFAAYGDAESYHRELEELRRQLISSEVR